MFPACRGGDGADHRDALRPVFATLGLLETTSDLSWQPEPGYTALFNGTDLTGWHVLGGTNQWQAVNNVLRNGAADEPRYAGPAELCIFGRQTYGGTEPLGPSFLATIEPCDGRWLFGDKLGLKPAVG